MLRIAMIGQKGIPTLAGGIERHVEELSLRLGKQGHEVLVYTRDWYAKPQRDLAPGVSTVSAPTIKTKHLDTIVHTFTATLKAIRSRVDIIHYHGVGPALMSWLPRLLSPRTRVVVTFHCIDRKHQKWGWLARWALGLGEWAACRFPHETITVSRTLTGYARDRYDREARYVPNGVSRIDISDVGTDELTQFGLEPDRYLMMCSRLVRHKGAHLLISAYRRLKAEGRHYGLKLALVGGSAFTDDYVKELKALAGNDPDIVFTDSVRGETLHQLFAHSYMVVHPSSSEGLPIAVLEAMSYGKSVLGSDIPEIIEVTREHGFAFRNRNLDELTESIAELIDNPEWVRQTGNRARSFVMANYAWDDISHEIGLIYRQLAVQVRTAAKRRADRARRTAQAS